MSVSPRSPSPSNKNDTHTSSSNDNANSISHITNQDDETASAEHPADVESEESNEKESDQDDPAVAEAHDASSDTPSTVPSNVNAAPSSSSNGDPDTGDWQAIFSPAHNAYYFFNSKTQVTTWTNPLQPPVESATDPASSSTSGPSDIASASTSTSSSLPADPASSHTSAHSTTIPPHLAQLYAAQNAAAAQGIDPALAFLDPTLANSALPGGGGTYAATAKFNARTGVFAKADARAPEHLGEYERAKRMSEFYFDTNTWEQDVAKRKAEEDKAEEEGRLRKKPTKQDMVRFICG
jgi:hypothetical protein